MKVSLPEHYSINLMSGEEFGPLWNQHAKAMFNDSQLIFHPYDHVTDNDIEKNSSLQKRLKEILRLRFGLFYKNEFVGWSWGFQETPETFYMCNSGVLPEHRRKGLYTALMQTLVKAAVDEGFQKIYSRHTTTNNAVIIPKLKAGFYITNLEVSDSFGTLVHLTYFPSALRNKVLNFRAGQIRPDEELKKVLKL
jgi:ribosomal protein S18 acetylase RimI-like enzyme